MNDRLALINGFRLSTPQHQTVTIIINSHTGISNVILIHEKCHWLLNTCDFVDTMLSFVESIKNRNIFQPICIERETKYLQF